MVAVALPAAGYFNSPITNSNAKNAQDATLAFLRQSIPGAAALGAYAMTSDAITPAGTSATFTVDTESAAASDNLSTIIQTNTTDGQVIALTQFNASRLVTVKHGIGGAGQILLRGDRDMLLDTETYLWLQRVGTNWVEISRTPGVSYDFYCGTVGGTANALALTPNQSPPAYFTGMRIYFIPTADNSSGSVTVTLPNLTAKNLRQRTGHSALAPLVIPSLRNGIPASAVYDGTQFVLDNARQIGENNAAVASSSTTDISTAVGDLLNITGTTTINALTMYPGQLAMIIFGGTLTLTHGANLVLPTGASIITTAGDVAIVRGITGGIAKVVSYMRTDGLPVKYTVDPTFTSMNDGQLAGFRNVLINGDMTIAQRGITAALTGTISYAAIDRWAAYTSSGAPGAIDRIVAGLNGFRNACKISRNSGVATTSQLALVQVVESINSIPYQGMNMTFSFWAKAGANFSGVSNALAVNVQSGTGTDQGAAIVGSWTGRANFISQNVVLTTSWQKFTVTGTVPSNATQLGVVLSYVTTGTAGADDSFSITGVQLEPGSVSTPFERRSIAVEQALCERYFEKSYDAGLFAGDTSGSSINGAPQWTARTADQNDRVNVFYKTRKRSTPTTLAIYAVNSGTQSNARNLTSAANLSVAVNSNGEAGFTLYPLANTVVANRYGFQYTSDAEL